MKIRILHSYDAECDKCKGRCKHDVTRDTSENTKGKAYWFTSDEVEEIFAALSCKINRIKAGDYTQTDEERKTDGKWIKDLEKIQKKLYKK